VRRFSNSFNHLNQQFLGFADQIARVLDGSGIRNVDGWCACRCPAHDDQRASLSLKDTPRGLVLKCFAGCKPYKVREAIAALLKGGLTLPPPVVTERCEGPTDRFLQLAAQRWHEGQPTPDTLAKRYLQGRRIELVSSALRFHPRLFHSESGTYAPAMIAVVQDVHGEACGLHRTWLDPACPAHRSECRDWHSCPLQSASSHRK
jgi:hypothetical protein